MNSCMKTFPITTSSSSVNIVLKITVTRSFWAETYLEKERYGCEGGRNVGRMGVSERRRDGGRERGKEGGGREGERRGGKMGMSERSRDGGREGEAGRNEGEEVTRSSQQIQAQNQYKGGSHSLFVSVVHNGRGFLSPLCL